MSQGAFPAQASWRGAPAAISGEGKLPFSFTSLRVIELRRAGGGEEEDVLPPPFDEAAPPPPRGVGALQRVNVHVQLRTK